MRLRPSASLQNLQSRLLCLRSITTKSPTMSTPQPQSSSYTTWTHSNLIKRITSLETQLRNLNNNHHSSPSSPSPPKKKARKPKKAFDPSKYSTRLIALKFAYLGGKYNGFEHHANNVTPLPTIEEELWRALVKTRLIFPKGGEEAVGNWEGCEYSKCGRTDRGVSAFGQVIGVRVRSARPKVKDQEIVEDEQQVGKEEVGAEEESEQKERKEFDPVRDELPYIQLINRVLPPDIRILAWCPNPPEGFSARFSCRERRYRYFFTNPAFMPLPRSVSSSSAPAHQDAAPAEGWLNIQGMHEAAQKYEGLHDFRNFCKVDPSKQISNFERRIFHAGIHEVEVNKYGNESLLSPKLYYFEVRGSAFLWHQVRHLVAVLFLVGQGYEKPGIVDELLDVQKTPSRPVYEMASDVPLVLWDCIFPDLEKEMAADHANGDGGTSPSYSPSYEEGLNWVYVGDEAGGRDQSKRASTAVEDGKYGRNGVMDELWALWRKRKMEEVLAWSLMGVVTAQGRKSQLNASQPSTREGQSDRLFDGSETPRTVGNYLPIAQRERMEPPDVVNARYRVRKGLDSVPNGAQDTDMDS